MDKQEKSKEEELAKKYNIDLKKLEKEQEKLAKQLKLKDSIDFSKVVKAGGISNVFFQNKIISAAIVINPDFQIVEQKYFSDKARFPYIPGFRAYRELPAMVSCFEQLEDKPEVFFIFGHGISHQRLGLASHFSLVTGIPAIGIADSLLFGEVNGENVVKNGKIVGRILKTKEGSRPLYVSPGNLISLESSANLVRKFIREPYKLPEPLRLAHKYSREVMKEIFKS